VKERLEHSLVEQHVAHRLRYDDVDQLGDFDLLNLAGDHNDVVLQLVVTDECLRDIAKCASSIEMYTGLNMIINWFESGFKLVYN